MRTGKPTGRATRTTVTLDADVRRRAAEFSRSRGIAFREGLNELVRLGLLTHQSSSAPEAFHIKPRSIGLRPGFSYDNIEELIELGEGPLHR